MSAAPQKVRTLRTLRHRGKTVAPGTVIDDASQGEIQTWLQKQPRPWVEAVRGKAEPGSGPKP